MKLSQKIQLLSILPLLLSMVAVAILTSYQFSRLSHETASAYRSNMISHRRLELKNYTLLALSAIDDIVYNRNLSEAEAKKEVATLLSDLSYGKDGYFFAYDISGVGIAHPTQPYRVGKDWWDLKDAKGQYIIRELVNKANMGGGYVEYVWHKPSSNTIEKKLGYAIMLDHWQWMLGTGIYIDDLDHDLAGIQQIIDKKITHSFNIILLIALSASLLIFSSGLILHFSERKLADSKLQELTKRVISSQDEERRRLSRELHDGISQMLVSAKFSLETARLKMKRKQEPSEDIEKGKAIISQSLQDLRRISRDLHPSILDDHGLYAGINSLAQSFTERTGIQVVFPEVSVSNLLPLDIKTTLYRIAQEALTNIERHAGATVVNIKLSYQQAKITLSIKDNGRGFDLDHLQKSKRPTEGIGLRNMKERIAYHGGELFVRTSAKGTLVQAQLSKSILQVNKSKNVGI